MGYSNGKIDRTGVSIADANAVLGTSYNNVRDICIAAAVNKWSIYKPVAHTIIAGSDSGALNAVEAKGAPTLINEGVIYGLKAGVDDNHWPNLHQCTYAFVGRSDGPNYPHRLSDLRGYDHNAKPTMLGSIVSQEINYNAINLRVGLLWQDTNNTTGVDILQMVAGSTNINNYYVNVLVDNYAITLLNVSTNTRTPIVYNGTKQNLFYINTLPSGYSTTRTASCTFFLSPILLTSWTNISTQTQQGPAIALPDAAGLQIKIGATNIDYGEWVISTIGGLGSTVSVTLNCNRKPGVARDYIATIQFQGQAAGQTKSFSVGAAGVSQQFVQWVAGEYGMTLTSSGNYSCTVSLYGVNNNVRTLLTQKTATVTLSPQ